MSWMWLCVGRGGSVGCFKGYLQCLALTISDLIWHHWNSKKSICEPVKAFWAYKKVQLSSIKHAILMTTPLHPNIKRWPMGPVCFLRAGLSVPYQAEPHAPYTAVPIPSLPECVTAHGCHGYTASTQSGLLPAYLMWNFLSLFCSFIEFHGQGWNRFTLSSVC